MARRSSQTSRGRRSGTRRKNLKGWVKFYAEKRREFQKQNPDLRNQEIMKKLGEMWRQCDAETKRQYESGRQTQNQGQSRSNEQSGGSKKGQSRSNEQSDGGKKGQNRSDEKSGGERKGQSSSQRQNSQQSNKENDDLDLSE